ncbi:hypothetical protein [Algoriphagus sp.]|uniref:hypothetical protein n=1 Tax=Algoriphagus sp. TaxID=1872435 RepID=UPI003F6FBEF9
MPIKIGGINERNKKQKMMKMLKLMILILLSASSLSGCVDDENNRYNLTCFDAEETFEVHNGVGTLIYTDVISSIKGDDFYYVIINDNVESMGLAKIVCNPGDFEVFNSTIDSVQISFKGIVEVLPETIDAGSVKIQIEAVESL